MPATWLIMVLIPLKQADFLLPVRHTPVCYICWGIQLLVSPLGNLLTLKSLTFCISFSAFRCPQGLSISHIRVAMTKTIPCDWWALIKLLLRTCMVLAAPPSQMIGQFAQQQLTMTEWEQLVLAQWLKQYGKPTVQRVRCASAPPPRPPWCLVALSEDSCEDERAPGCSTLDI